MRKITLREKKNQKGFYSTGFRYSVNVLLFSLILNFVLTAAIHNRLLHIPSTSFYSTDGVSEPMRLTPLDAPNESSQPLLPDDPPEEMGIRELPPNF